LTSEEANGVGRIIIVAYQRGVSDEKELRTLVDAAHEVQKQGTKVEA
jgi:hypothetical protein